MAPVKKNIGRLPMNFGDYDSTKAYGKKNRCFQYGCEVESKVENNTYPPFSWDGAETFVLDDAHWLLVSGNPEVWAEGNPKPATSEQFPYNGMGRVTLKKNLVEVEVDGQTVTKNLLYQDDFYKGEVGSRVPNTNTVFEVPYEFELAEDIEIPDGCVLEFKGGSISGAHKLKGMYIDIVAAPVKIFGIDVIFDWYWNNTVAYPEWFGAVGYGNVDDGPAIQKAISVFRKVILSKPYKSNQSIQIGSHREIVGIAPNQAGITFSDSVTDGLIQSISEETIRGVTIKNLLISKDTKTSESSGIKFSQSSQVLLEQINVSYFTYGYNLNSFYLCKILKCIATGCDYGFYFGINDGNSTSTNLESCYALQCDTGYELKYISYSTFNNCAADRCRICYDFWHAYVQLIGCGSESTTGRLFTLIGHGNDKNYAGNKISIKGFVAYDYNSLDAPIQIITDTRDGQDRNVITIENIHIGLHTIPSSPRQLIEHGGDTQIYLNNFTDNESIEAVTFNYNKGDNTLYRNNLRLVNILSLHSQYSYLIVPNFIGEQIMVYDSGRTYIGMWNGTNWVDNEGNILDQVV